MKTPNNKFVVRKAFRIDENTASQIASQAAEYNITETDLIRKFIQQGLARTLPSLDALSLSPTASFYESVAFALASLVQRGLDLPKSKQDVIALIQQDMLVQMGVTNEETSRTK